MPATVSAIIINYNGETFVEDCVRSLISQSVPPNEVIIVDNGSTDASVKLLQSSFPEITVVASDQNIGFPAACNKGVQTATSELIAILNNDVILEDNWLEALLAQVKPAWSFWASRIVFAADPTRVDSAGDGMAVIGSGFKIGHGDLAENYATQREVFGPCAAAALYRRSLLDTLGGFDEDFFLVYEDADLNMRARLLGFRCLYVPDATVHHMVNRSIGTFSHTYVYYGHRNSEALFWKNMPTRLIWRYFPERVLFNLISFSYFLIKGRGISFLKAKLDFLRVLPKTLRKRRKIQDQRTTNDEELRRLLDRNWFRNRRKAASPR